MTKSGNKQLHCVVKKATSKANCQGCLLAANADSFLPECVFFLSFLSLSFGCLRVFLLLLLLLMLDFRRRNKKARCWDLSRAIDSWSPRIYKHFMSEWVREKEILEKQEKVIFQEDTFHKSTWCQKTGLPQVIGGSRRHEKNVSDFSSSQFQVTK